MASFPSATRALQFAATLQRAVGAHAEAGGEPLRVRVGVNAAAFRALGFRTRDPSDESLWWLGEAFLGWAVRNGRSFADPAMVAHFGNEMPRIMRANPVVQVPGDVLLVARVLGLLSGIGKQLGSSVDVGAALIPYLALSTEGTSTVAG